MELLKLGYRELSSFRGRSIIRVKLDTIKKRISGVLKGACCKPQRVISNQYAQGTLFMKRAEQIALNKRTISIVHEFITLKRFFPPSYKLVCNYLNSQHLTTSRGNKWTPKRLFRMLQRNGFSGLFGLYKSDKD